jgi:hypothetical protein
MKPVSGFGLPDASNRPRGCVSNHAAVAANRSPRGNDTFRRKETAVAVILSAVTRWRYSSPWGGEFPHERTADSMKPNTDQQDPGDGGPGEIQSMMGHHTTAFES